MLNAKLQQGLVITQDALYHRKCKLDLYRKANDKQQWYYTGVQRQLHGIAFSEIISFIQEEFNTSWEFVRLFKLTDKVFCETLESLGLQVKDRIHGTRLKQWILQSEDLKEYREGPKIILPFAENVGEILPRATSIDHDGEGYILADTAHVIRFCREWKYAPSMGCLWN